MLIVGSFSAVAQDFLLRFHEKTHVRYDLLGHFCGHAMLAAAMLNTCTARRIIAFLTSSAIAALIEGMQSLPAVRGRRASLDDLVAASVGAAVGTLGNNLPESRRVLVECLSAVQRHEFWVQGYAESTDCNCQRVTASDSGLPRTQASMEQTLTCPETV